MIVDLLVKEEKGKWIERVSYKLNLIDNEMHFQFTTKKMPLFAKKHFLEKNFDCPLLVITL
jgi:hypothetical protein